MEKMFNWISIAFAAVGGGIAYVLGGWDKWAVALVALIVIDYLTGVIKAAINKALSSEVGFKGILKKVLILCMVALAVVLQNGIGIPIREVTICFYIANEGLSILENVAPYAPVPDKLKEALAQLRDKTKVTDGEGSHENTK